MLLQGQQVKDTRRYETDLAKQARLVRLETASTLSNQVRIASTKMTLDLKPVKAKRDLKNELEGTLTELEAKTRHILNLKQVLDNLDKNKELQDIKHGVHGQIAEAVANLTMFQKECFDDVLSMTAKRSDVESELRDR
jgi:uncharacterized protein YicC (UPF0701 family)